MENGAVGQCSFLRLYSILRPLQCVDRELLYAGHPSSVIRNRFVASMLSFELHQSQAKLAHVILI
jgi:hypothetical protein